MQMQQRMPAGAAKPRQTERAKFARSMSIRASDGSRARTGIAKSMKFGITDPHTIAGATRRRASGTGDAESRTRGRISDWTAEKFKCRKYDLKHSSGGGYF